MSQRALCGLPGAFLVAPALTLLRLASAAPREDATAWRSQSAFPRGAVLRLPCQKAGPIFTYHFDTILGCNWN